MKGACDSLYPFLVHFSSTKFSLLKSLHLPQNLPYMTICNLFFFSFEAKNESFLFFFFFFFTEYIYQLLQNLNLSKAWMQTYYLKYLIFCNNIIKNKFSEYNYTCILLFTLLIYPFKNTDAFVHKLCNGNLYTYV